MSTELTAGDWALVALQIACGALVVRLLLWPPPPRASSTAGGPGADGPGADGPGADGPGADAGPVHQRHDHRPLAPRAPATRGTLPDRPRPAGAAARGGPVLVAHDPGAAAVALARHVGALSGPPSRQDPSDVDRDVLATAPLVVVDDAAAPAARTALEAGVPVLVVAVRG